MLTIRELEKELEQTPYTADVKLVARSVGQLLNEPRSYDGSNVNDEFVSYAENIWRHAQRVVLWWTPARIEEEALRRAGDEVEPSIIAQEHHLFLAIFLKWEGMFMRWAPSIDDGITNVPGYIRTQERNLLRRAMFIRDGISHVLGVLERKAASAEGRAMDIRLRVDHEKIAQLIAGHELVSRLQQLVDLAARGSAGQEHLRTVVEQLVEPVTNAARALGSLENAADFACDKLVQHQPKERARLKLVAAVLVNAAANSGTKLFFEHLLRLLS